MSAQDDARRGGFQDLIKAMNKVDVKQRKSKKEKKEEKPAAKAETKPKTPVEKKEKPEVKTPKVTESMKATVQAFFKQDAERRKQKDEGPTADMFVGRRKNLNKPKAAAPVKVAKRKKRA